MPVKLSIVTPAGTVAEATADHVVVPGVEGEFGVLPGHAPFLSALKPGVVRYEVGGQRHRIAVSTGFVEVTLERVTLLARTAERPEVIDRGRAEAALSRAREGLRSAGPAAPGDAVERLQAELDRAAARLAALER